MSHDSLRARLSLIGATITLAQVRERFAKGKPDQPRVPAGNKHGGEWTKGPFSMFGGYSKPPSKPPPSPYATTHPRVDDEGKAVTIEQPTQPTDASTWHAADKVATFVPDGKTPKSLMGVAMTPWTPPKSETGWASVEGQDPLLDTQPPTPVRGKTIAAGVIVMEPDGRIWTVRPTNGWAGYFNTFPKGTQEPGMSLQATAIREMYEETGLKVKLTGLLGDFERSGSVSRYYVGVRTGGTPARMGWEAQAVRLSPQSALPKLLNRSVDRRIAAALAHESSIGKAFDPTKHPRWPAGTPLGGQFMALDVKGIPLQPQIGGGVSNPQYQKKADALYALAQSGDWVGLKQHVAALQKKAEDAKAKAKLNSHDQWTAKLAQYGQALVDAETQGHVEEAKTDKVEGPLKLSDMTMVAPKPGGQSPGAIYQDANGVRWLVKGNAQKVSGNVSETQSDDRARNEVTAAHLFNAAGVQAPDMKLIELGAKYGGGLGVASQMLDGMESLNIKDPDHLAAAQQTFAAQAWLRNHDALGNSNDNITIAADGQAVAIDPGGALMFKGWGLPKPDGVPENPSEWTTMRDKNKAPTAAPVFGSMTQDQLTQSAAPLAGVTDEQVKTIVDTYGPGNKEAKEKLANNLMARRDAILELAGLDKSGMPLVAKPTTTAVTPTATATAGKPSLPSSFQSTQSLDTAAKMMALHAAGDVKALAQISNYSPGITALDMATLSNYKSALLADLAAKPTTTVTPVIATAIAATAVTAASNLQVPKFNSGFKSADATYEQFANDMLAAHASGYAQGILNLKTKAGADVPKTASAQLLSHYADALLVDLNTQATNTAMKPATPQSVAPSTNVPTQGTAKTPNLPAMPVFDKAKISETNSNAPSHNSKVDTIAMLAKAGNEKALLALPFSINTYGVKQAALANEALAALGSKEKVAPGQKKGAHASFTGNLQDQQAATATANLATANTDKVHTVDTSKLPKPPDYNTLKQGGPMHSAAWKNEANNKEGAHIYSLAMGPNPVDALKAYTIVSPSKYLVEYKDGLLSEIDSQLHPPEPIKILDHTGATLDLVGLQHIKSAYPVGTAHTKIKAQERLAFYVALAVIKNNIKWNDSGMPQSEQWVKDGYDDFHKMSAVSQNAVGVQQGSPKHFRDKGLNDKVGYSGHSLKEIMEAWNKDAKIVPQNTKLYRYVRLDTPMIDQLLAAEPGTVVADLSPAASSRDNGRNKKFGSHKIEFITGPDVRAIKSYGSKNYDSEMETTLLPGQRWLIHKVRKRANGSLKIKAILLPTMSPLT